MALNVRELRYENNDLDVTYPAGRLKDYPWTEKPIRSHKDGTISLLQNSHPRQKPWWDPLHQSANFGDFVQDPFYLDLKDIKVDLMDSPMTPIIDGIHGISLHAYQLRQKYLADYTKKSDASLQTPILSAHITTAGMMRAFTNTLIDGSRKFMGKALKSGMHTPETIDRTNDTQRTATSGDLNASSLLKQLNMI